MAFATLNAPVGLGRLPLVSVSASAAHVAHPLAPGALLASHTAKSSASSVQPSSATPHVLMIVEENEAYSSIIGNSSNAPYLNSLANTYASATKWYAVQHNSPHDYLDLLAGSDLGLPANQPYSSPTLVDELHSAGISTQAYMESMPSNCFKGTTSNALYDPNHNPFHYFTNYKSTSGGWCSSANLSTQGIVPYTGSGNLVSTLDANNPPDYVYLVPNDCNDMHGDTVVSAGCSKDSNNQLIAAGDSWLSTNLAPVLTSSWFQQNGIVIITWDEGVGKQGCCGLTAPGGQIATIVVTANNRGLGKFTATGDHYGTLRAVEEAYGVADLGNSANSVNGDLTGAFGTPPSGGIAGNVVDTETPAQPVSGATVSYTGSNGTGSTTTNSSGNYAFSGVAAGSYTVSVTDNGFTSPSSQGVGVTNATVTANFTMTANSGIGGTLTNSDGSGIAGVTVTYAGTGGSTGTGSLTTSSSPYSFTGVPPGTYNVSAGEPGFTSPPSQKVTVLANGTATANFVMAAQAAIGGTVTNGANGIQGATVGYTGPNGSGTTQTSDSAGDYQLTGVPDGTYSVTASDATYQPETFTVTVTGTGTTSQSFVLATGTNGSIAGTVTDAQTSNPISGVTVNDGKDSPVTTDAAGNYVIENVAPNTYPTVTFSASNYVTATASVTVTTSANTQKNVALTETGTISGTVTDAVTHSAIVGATLTCASCPVTSVPTDFSGNYSFNQIAPGGGPYTVSVTATGYTGQTSSPLTVNPGGTTTQNFQLAKPVTLSVHETFGAANTGSTGGTTMTAVPGTPTGSGDLLVATIKLRVTTGSVTVKSVTDSAGNVWTKATAVFEGGSGLNDEEIWYAAASSSVSSVQTNPGVTVTSTTGAAIAFSVIDVAGASTLDATKTNFGTVAPPQPSVGPTATTTHPTEIVIAAIGWNGTATLSGQTSGYATQTVQQSSVTSLKTAEQAAWLILASPGTPSYGANLSATSAWTAAIATFG
ncbi:MAG: carboxypeptidase regulatory-like domain-containing protein [Candidatus Dormibacteria bacterium]